ncbi:MAG: DegT/DnrJ/EryC1/StrS family aminotransferase [Candidatus Moranbacteria bacterium]|nr:DegT/DnrJ/EryC1/StrS family aminotransferase [Candidatus Moranbacteria bacterium]
MPNRPSFENPVVIAKPVLVDLDDFKGELQEVWKSGWLTNNGYKHQELEARLQAEIFDGFPTSLVSNATIGLIVAFKTLGITSGEVITTPFTFPATPHSITWAGLKPVFCDIDPDSMNIDVKKIESLITADTKAILAVHVFGRACEVEKIAEIARKHDLKVIYDAAHAFELELNGKSVACYGDASVFSFHATKLFHTVEGGAIVFKDKHLKEKCDIVKNFGIKNEEVIECGINGKMNELQASIGLLMLTEKDIERNHRAMIEGIFHDRLGGVDGVILPRKSGDVTKESLQYFVIRINAAQFGFSRDYVHENLKKHNVFSRKYFYPLCSNAKFYRDFFSAKEERLPIANDVADRVLALPFHGGISPDDAERICDLISSFKGN